MTSELDVNTVRGFFANTLPLPGCHAAAHSPKNKQIGDEPILFFLQLLKKAAMS